MNYIVNTLLIAAAVLLIVILAGAAVTVWSDILRERRQRRGF